MKLTVQMVYVFFRGTYVMQEFDIKSQNKTTINKSTKVTATLSMKSKNHW